MTTTLVIDAASERYAVALGRDGKLLDMVEGDSRQDHSRVLLRAVDDVTGGERTAIKRIVVTRGPGNYTGLRVGSATAQGLALALNVPVAGIPTLRLVAEACGGSKVIAVHPAGRGDFAMQPFVDGEAVDALTIVASGEIVSAGALAGEGAGVLGGREVGPADRARAAIRLDAGTPGMSGDGPEPIYLREPNITRPRRPYGDAGSNTGGSDS